MARPKYKFELNPAWERIFDEYRSNDEAMYGQWLPQTVSKIRRGMRILNITNPEVKTARQFSNYLRKRMPVTPGVPDSLLWLGYRNTDELEAKYGLK